MPLPQSEVAFPYAVRQQSTATPTNQAPPEPLERYKRLGVGGQRPGRSADGSGAFDEIPGVMLVDRPLVVGHLGLLDLIDPAKLFGHDVY